MIKNYKTTAKYKTIGQVAKELDLIDKKERIGRNPKTNVEAKICARKIVKFKPSLKTKEKINS